MGKLKLLTITLAIVILALCLAIYYTQRKLNIMRINFNRSDRELALLKEDYNELYQSYYRFDDKIKLILSLNPSTRWSTDSSAYMLGNRPNVYLGFINKKPMKKTFYVWETIQEFQAEKYIRHTRVDTIKPHELVSFAYSEPAFQLVIAPSIEKDTNLPDLKNTTTTIPLK